MNTIDVNELITIERYKNGAIKLVHGRINQTNIHKLIRDLGYRKSTLNKKKIYYKRDVQNLIRVSNYQELKGEFRSLLRNAYFSNKPDDLGHTDILNWLLNNKDRLKQIELDRYLSDTLTESELHEYILQADHIYKAKFQFERAISSLTDLGFSSTVNNGDIGFFAKGLTMYYKHLLDNRYLVFIHHEATLHSHDGFEGLLATYLNEKHIGNRKAINEREVYWNPCEEKGLREIKEFITI